MKLQENKSSVPVQIDPNGAVSVRVNPTEFWDLVEYLSYHRLNVSFTFLGPEYLASFGGASPATVKSILSDWKKAAARDAQTAAMAH